MIYCGVSEKIITPQMGMSIPGYFEDRKMCGVLDDLYVRALILKGNGIYITVIACDIINLDRQDVLRIRKKVSEQTDIPVESIVVHATHTHTGGPTWKGFETKRNQAYLAFLISRACEAVKEAYIKLSPAKIGFATGKVSQISFIRRFFMKEGTVKTNPRFDDMDIIRPEGVPDETFTIAKITDLDEKPIAFWSNFGVHLDTIGGCEISADYAGVLSQKIKQEYGEHVVSLFCTGPCGNTNHRNIHDDSTLTEPNMREKIGNALFSKLLELEKKVDLNASPWLESHTRRFLVNLRKPNEEQLLWAKDVLSGELQTENNEMFDPRLFAQMILDCNARTDFVQEVEIMVQAIGDNLFIAWPGEMFVDFGMAIREDFPNKNIMIAELSNGTISCYVPTEDAFLYGGYETCISANLSTEVKCGTIIVKETRELLTQI